MEMYSREEIEEQKQLRRNAKIAMAVSAVAAAVVCVFLLCTVKPLTEGRFRLIACIIAVLAGCVVIYLSSFVLPYARPKPKKRAAGGKVLHVLGNILRQMHMYVIWGVLAVMIVNFLFGLVTDTRPQKKVSVFAQVDEVDSPGLETILNEGLPEGIKMTKVHSFGYYAFGNEQLGPDDIYIVRKTDVQKYIESFAPLENYWDTGDGGTYYEKDGVPYGILVRSSDERLEAAADYIGYEYIEGRSQEEYYLFFGKDCLHPGKDGAAAGVARRLLSIK